MQTEKPTIVWDVDDVLNALTRSWFEDGWMKSHPECRLNYGELVRNPPHELLGVELGDYLASLDQYRLSGAYAELPPAPATLAWFQAHGGKFRHIALTAAPLKCAHISAEWTISHFGQWIRSFNFVPSKRDGESFQSYDRTKCEFLAWLGKGDAYIDDNGENIAAATTMGLRTVLVPQPWNGEKGSLTDCLGMLLQNKRSPE